METADVVIRSAEPGDAEAISALLGTVGTVEGTLQMPDVPVASRVEGLRKLDPAGCRLVAVSADQVVGMAELFPMPSLRRAHVRLLAIALLPQWQGRGLGRRLMERLLHWADAWACVLRIELVVHADNPRATALYESLGFVEEGRHRAYALKDGRYVDAVSMARLHPRPPRVP